MKHGVTNKRPTGLLCFELQMKRAFVTQKKKKHCNTIPGHGDFLSQAEKTKDGVYTYICRFPQRHALTATRQRQ